MDDNLKATVEVYNIICPSCDSIMISGNVTYDTGNSEFISHCDNGLCSLHMKNYVVSLPKVYLRLKNDQSLPDDITGCPMCCGRLAIIRGKFPGDDKRTVCPTCLQERMEQIYNVSSHGYGVPCQDESN